MLLYLPSIMLLLLIAYGFNLLSSQEGMVPFYLHAPASPPPPAMLHMQQLITQAGGMQIFNHLAATILSQPMPENEAGAVFNTNDELDAWIAPEYATLQELLRAPAEEADCINEALLRRPYRLAWNAIEQRWVRLQRVRIQGSPDVWTPYNNSQFLAHGGTILFEVPFRRLFRAIHQRPLGEPSLNPAAVWDIVHVVQDEAAEEEKEQD